MALSGTERKTTFVLRRARTGPRKSHRAKSVINSLAPVASVVNRGATRKTAAAEQGGKPRIAAIRIPLGIDRQIDKVDVARRVGLVEPPEELVCLSETGMHKSHRIGRHVPLSSISFQFAQNFPSLGGASGLRQQIAPQGDRRGITSRETCGVGERHHGQFRLTCLFVCLCQFCISNPQLRVDQH
jgi:hypothetical protein